MPTTEGRGGGGHGGHHGGHHGGGIGPVWYDPWEFYDVSPDSPEDCKESHKKHVVGQGELSTGTGALMVLGLLAWLVWEADKRVPS
jgi:hypothetical protein